MIFGWIDGAPCLKKKKKTQNLIGNVFCFFFFKFKNRVGNLWRKNKFLKLVLKIGFYLKIYFNYFQLFFEIFKNNNNLNKMIKNKILGIISF